jgi:calnexin
LESDDTKFADGQWAVTTNGIVKGITGERGLYVRAAARHHAISAAFSKPLSGDKNDIVIQYEVKLHKQHECGGAYLKLPIATPGKTFEPTKFKDSTQYAIMFGPDRCGETDKVHFIFRHQNPVSKEWEEKHLVSPPKIRNDRLTHLYVSVCFLHLHQPIRRSLIIIRTCHSFLLCCLLPITISIQ